MDKSKLLELKKHFEYEIARFKDSQLPYVRGVVQGFKYAIDDINTLLKGGIVK